VDNLNGILDISLSGTQSAIAFLPRTKANDLDKILKAMRIMEKLAAQNKCSL
jgi:hypothetical protein